MFTQNTVTVITATTGCRHLLQCLQSIQEQTYPHVEHFVVVDGPEHEEKVEQAVAQLCVQARPVSLIRLPCATGKQRWQGHRIYGAMSFLSNAEFVCFLDEDNWFDSDHLASLVTAIRTTRSQWAFSLRKVVDQEGQFIAPDNCESPGNLHPTFNDRTVFLVDANCYLLRREVAVRFAPTWYGRGIAPDNQTSPDRVLCGLLLEQCPEECSNLKHTVNYRMESTSNSIRSDFILNGNQIMRSKYPDGLPWEQPGQQEEPEQRQETPEELNRQGLVLASQRQYVEATECFAHAILLRMDYPEARLNLAMALKCQGQIEEAVKVFQRCAELTSSNPAPLSHLGSTYQERGQFSEAQASFRKAAACASWSVLWPALSHRGAETGFVIEEQGASPSALGGSNRTPPLRMLRSGAERGIPPASCTSR